MDRGGLKGLYVLCGSSHAVCKNNFNVRNCVVSNKNYEKQYFPNNKLCFIQQHFHKNTIVFIRKSTRSKLVEKPFFPENRI